MQGPANIRENVTLSADGNSYSGSFSIDQYDTQLNLKAHIIGTSTPPASPSTPSHGSVLGSRGR